MQVKISDSIKYIGVDDKTIDLFESQYLVPNGISYNSYLILDEKVAIMDTVDKRKTDEWLENLDRELNGRTPDYLVISHLEPDHASNIEVVSEKYPSMKLVGNAKTFSMLPQFFPDFEFADKTVTVKEGDELALKIFDFTGTMLGMQFADFIAFSAPEAIVLFGGLARSREFLTEPIERAMNAYCLPFWKNKVKIVYSSLKESDAAILGASALAWEL